jgi:hypothetical protein
MVKGDRDGRLGGATGDGRARDRIGKLWRGVRRDRGRLDGEEGFQAAADLEGFAAAAGALAFQNSPDQPRRARELSSESGNGQTFRQQQRANRMARESLLVLSVLFVDHESTTTLRFAQQQEEIICAVLCVSAKR